MSQRDEIEASAEELLLVDLLYGELDEQAATSARQTVAADPELSAQAEAYRGMRELFRELPAEEPPAAVSAQLLHAAASRAPSALPEAAGDRGFLGFFRRLFQPLLLHPAMAAATTFVLIAGVAGTLYLVGGVGVSQRQATPAATGEARSELEEAPAVPAATPALDPGRGATLDETISDNRRDQAAAGGDGVGFGTIGTSRGATGAKPKPKAPVDKRAGSERYRRTLDGNADLDLEAGELQLGLANEPAPPPSGGKLADKSPTTTTGAGHSVEGSSQQVISVETEPPPLKQLDDSRDRSSNGDSLQEQATAEEDQAPPADAPEQKKDQAEKSKAESAPSAVERLHDQARKAARDGECRAVLALGKKIHELDAGYYAKVFLADAQLTACLHPPAAKKR